ncbi:hypothetical protein ACFLYP_00955 [Chloroflexota bacterium]
MGALFKKHPFRVFFDSAFTSQTPHVIYIEGDIERFLSLICFEQRGKLEELHCDIEKS